MCSDVALGLTSRLDNEWGFVVRAKLGRMIFTKQSTVAMGIKLQPEVGCTQSASPCKSLCALSEEEVVREVKALLPICRS